MGKIKVRTLGTDQEEIQKNRAKQKNKEKKLVKGTKGYSTLRDEPSGSDSKSGERVVEVGPSEEELKAVILSEAKHQTVSGEAKESQIQKTSTSQTPSINKKTKQKKTKERTRSKSYAQALKTLDKSKKYSLPEALVVLEKLKRSKFDETVELHINTIKAGVSGSLTLPYGTGKQVRVAIADPSTSSGQVDDLLKKIEQGIIEFDVLLATPAAMPKLARVAKILGPKGLMPNPKNATLVKDPEKAAENFKKGQVNFKTELKAPIMHLTVGKMSFGAKKLSENISALIEAVKKEKIRNITLKSTMSPGIKLEI